MQFEPRITENFTRLEPDIARAALDGVRPTSELVQGWHIASLAGVPLAEPWVAGHYRGQGPRTSQLFSSQNHVNGILGTPPTRVRPQVADTFKELETRLDGLDARCTDDASVEDVYEEVLATCAWLHGQWIRIHPFVDLNGSTARLLTVMVGLRYGIPMRLPGKPRSQMPTAGLVLDYNVAAGNQMVGDDQLMVQFLDDLVRQTVKQATSPLAAASVVAPGHGTDGRGAAADEQADDAAAAGEAGAEGSSHLP